MNLDCIAQLLIAGGAATALGTDIFEHHMPEECTLGILLKLPISGIRINHYIPGFLKANLQVIVRAPTHEQGDPIAKQALSLLKVYEQDFPGATPSFFVKQMFPTALPIVYPRSAGNIYEWSVPIECTYVTDQV